MRIAMVVGVFPLLSEIYIVRQTARLIELGHEVDLYTLTHSGSELATREVERYKLGERLTCMGEGYLRQGEATWIARTGQRIELLFSVVLRMPKVSINVIECNLKHPGRWWAALYYLKILRKMRSRNYDIIHCNIGGLANRFVFSKQFLNTKFVTSFSGSDYHTFPEIYGKSMYKKLFATADAITVVCEQGRRDLISMGCPQNKLVVFARGINTDLFPFHERQRPVDQPVQLLTVARLVDIKGLEWAIRAVAIIAREQSVRYEIVGDGPLLSGLETLVDSLQLNKIISFSGAATSEEVSSKMANAHIFLLPSLKEGLPNVMLEAQSTGLPVIATRVGGIVESLPDEHSEFLVPARDEHALADRVTYLIEHPEIWSEMGRTGRKYVEKHFKFNQLTDRLNQLYKDLLASAPGVL